MSDLTLNRTEPLTPTNGRPVGQEALEAELAAVQHRLAALEAILNDLPLAVFMADVKTGLPQFVNKAGLDLLGRGVNPQRSPGDSTEVFRTYLPRSTQFYPVQDLPIVRTMATGQPAQGEMDIQQAERRVTVNVTTTPIRDAEGRVVSAAAVYQPIADHQPADTALLESQPIFQTFIEASGSVLYRRDHQAGRYTYMGEGIRAMTGYGPEEMTTQILETLIEENIPMGEAKAYGSLAEAVEQAQRGQLNTWRSDLRIRTRDGQTRWVSDASIEIKDATGTSVGSIGILQDITERKLSEEALREREEHQRLLLDSSPDPIVTYDTDGKATYINPAFVQTFGWQPEELLGKRIDFVPEESQEETRAYLQEALDQGRLTLRDTKRLTKDGRILNILMSGAVLRNKNGEATGLIVILRDITERKQAEQILSEREEDLTALLEFSPEAIGVVNTQTGLFDNVNSAAERLYGLPRDELVKVGPAQMSPEFQPDGRPSFDAAMKEIGAALQGGRPVFEWTHRNATGQLIPCEVRLVGLAPPRQHLVRFSVTDITQRKQAEEALVKRAAELEEARNFLDTILESVTIPMLISRISDGFVIYANQLLADMLRLPLEELVGRVTPNFYYAIEDRAPFVKQLREQGQVNNYEMRLKRTTGEDFWGLLSARTLNFQGEAAIMTTLSDITERRVAEATLAKRATELEVVAQVGTAAATILEPLQLLQTVVDLTKSNFNLYHAHVYLLNDAGDALELAAGAGEVGSQMVAQGWRIPLSREHSLVARAGRTRQGVRVNDVRESPDFLPNPLLPDTRAEMALPIIAGDRVLGVLDVQADEPGRFTNEDLQIQSILATQIAVALQNARQFAEARRLADRETLVNAISQQIQGATTVESALQIAARELGRALRAQRTVVQLNNPDLTPRALPQDEGA